MLLNKEHFTTVFIGLRHYLFEIHDDALVKQYGAAAGRLTVSGVSYLAPVSNSTDTGRAKNRQVELVLF